MKLHWDTESPSSRSRLLTSGDGALEEETVVDGLGDSRVTWIGGSPQNRGDDSSCNMVDILEYSEITNTKSASMDEKQIGKRNLELTACWEPLIELKGA